MGFTREELEFYVGATVPDLIGPDLRLLFVGINPGLWTAATQTHFAHPGNRFYPALFAAGVIDRPIDRGVGMSDDGPRLLSRPRSRDLQCCPSGHCQGVRTVRRRTPRWR